MNANKTGRSDLEVAIELFRLLQGTAPERFQGVPPRLDANTTWSVVDFVASCGFLDVVQRCGVCGELSTHDPRMYSDIRYRTPKRKRCPSGSAIMGTL